MSGAIVRNTESSAHLAKLLDQATPRLVALVPPGMSVERIKAVTMNVYARDPNVRECTPASVVQAIVQITEWGLDVSPKLGQAFIIPRNVKVRGGGWEKRAEAQLGYKGILAKAYRCERILSVNSVVVHEHDVFRISRGTTPSVQHSYQPSTTRGEPSGLYFVARLTPATSEVWSVDEMSVADVNAIRDRSDGFRAFKAGRIKSHPWDWAWDEMARKTMLIRGLKQCPIDDGFRAALEKEPDDFRGVAAEEGSSRAADIKARLGVPATVDTDGEEVEEEPEEGPGGS